MSYPYMDRSIYTYSECAVDYSTVFKVAFFSKMLLEGDVLYDAEAKSQNYTEKIDSFSIKNKIRSF